MISINKSYFKSKIKKNPFLENLVIRIYKKNLLNNIKKRNNGKGNKITYDRTSILSNVEFKTNGNNNTIIIGAKCYLKNVKFNINGDNHVVKIGNRIRFNGESCLWFEDKNGTLTIGNDSTFQGVHIAVTENNSSVTIGNDCMFAQDIDVRTGDSHSIIDTDTNIRINGAKNVVIGNHVWVASHCIILKGNIVPDNCVIATGSIITKSFKNRGVIIAGNPGKIVKENINWDRKRI